MSASLVGSEMCIRDSVGCATSGARAGRRQSECPSSGPEGPKIVARLKGFARSCVVVCFAAICLLYTSPSPRD
eukprot:1101161-Alexandrium_andersonii.AAC.1